MKNIKIKSILLGIVLLSVMSFVSTVNAAGASVYVSPASITKTAGDVFNVSVGFNTSGNKVCAVEGTLNFKNLSCQSITVASGFMTQATPTCSNPYFMIGIPNCSTVDKVLMTVSVKAGGAGIASISPISVDVIGEGSSAGSGSIAGNYTINAVLVPKTIPTVVPQPSNGFVGYVNGKIQTFATMELAQQAGATGIQPNYQYSPSGTTIAPTKKETTNIDPITTTSTTENPDESSQLATVGVASSETTSSNWFNYFAIVFVILIALYSIYYFMKRKKI